MWLTQREGFEDRLGVWPPTPLHQPPVGRGTTDEQQDSQQEQGQADAGHCARCGASRRWLRHLA